MLLTTIDFVSGDIFLTFPFTNEGGGGGVEILKIKYWGVDKIQY